MIKTCILILLVLLPFLNFSQYCINVGPSATADSNVQSVSLSGDGDNLSFNGCPGVVGLQDITNQSTTLTSGNSYVLTVLFGTCGGNFVGKGEVWIDYNGDNIFNLNESIGTWTGIPPTVESVFNFTVPSVITNGITRIRISQQEGSSVTLPLDPCASFQWGSTMDFHINLTGGMDCSGFVGNTLNDPIVTNTFPFSHAHSTSVCYSNNDFAYQSADVYYLVLPNSNSSSLNVSLCGSSFDTFLSVFNTSGNTLAFNDDGNCGSQSELSFSTVGLDSVYVVVQGWGIENGDYELNIIESILGIDNQKNLNAFVYPNPASEQFSIKNVSNERIMITDVLGKIIVQLDIYNGEIIPITSFSQGLYFISYSQNNKGEILKLIVK